MVRHLYFVPIMLASVILSACSNTGHPVPASSFAVNSLFKGKLKIVIVDAGKIFAYEISLNAGQIAQPAEIDENTLQHMKLPPGANSPQSLGAPSGEYVALNDGNGITVLDKHGAHAGVLQVGPPNRVTGIAWSPDSRALAVLSQQDRNNFLSQQGVMGVLSGHWPILTSYQVTLFSLPNGLSATLPIIRNDVQGGWAAVEWFSNGS